MIDIEQIKIPEPKAHEVLIKTYSRGLDILKQYQLEIEELITGKYTLEDTKEALDQAIVNKQDMLKLLSIQICFRRKLI